MAHVLCFLSYIFIHVIFAHGRSTQKVLLVSMDGFRWDYTNKWPTPNFDKMAEYGTKAPFINNTFITKTFPSHYSVATGLYEESHGIVGNVMYDPELNETFRIGNFDPKWWNGGEPIWVTARKAGLRSATFFWPGSEAEVRGIRPIYYKTYDKSVLFKDRIKTVTNWLKSDIDVAVMYFHEPDATGHRFGPDAEETRAKVIEMDKVLGDLMDKLEDEGLWDNVNLIVTSDHGMTEVDFRNKVVDISTVVDLTAEIERTVDAGPIMQIVPFPDMETNVYNNLKTLNNVDVYLKENIPDFWHYRNNQRIMPILVVAQEGWSIVTNATQAAVIPNRGNHGYDNRLMSMKPIFYARGPNIRRNFTATPFISVDIYEMICSILKIEPAPNNGSLARVQQFLIGENDALKADGLRNNFAYLRSDVSAITVLVFMSFVVFFMDLTRRAMAS